MRLEVGKTYTNGRGETRTIEYFDETDQCLPFRDNRHDWYSFDGIYDGDNCQPDLNLHSDGFTVRLSNSASVNIAVIRLLVAQGYDFESTRVSFGYLARNASMLIFRSNGTADWSARWDSCYVVGEVFDITQDPIDTNITFADGTSVELSRESFDKLRNA